MIIMIIIMIIILVMMIIILVIILMDRFAEFLGGAHAGDRDLPCKVTSTLRVAASLRTEIMDFQRA